MKNKLSLSFWIIASFIITFSTSCKKENYDNSTTTSEEIIPEPNYTGDDNSFSFALTKLINNTTSTQGGLSFINNITKEVLSNGEIRWKLFSTITDGVTVTNEITFVTPNTDAGTYPIEELYFLNTDATGTIINEYTWVNADMTNGVITVSGLTDTPGIVSGNIEDLEVIITPDSLEYRYGVTFSEVPIN